MVDKYICYMCIYFYLVKDVLGIEKYCGCVPFFGGGNWRGGTLLVGGACEMRGNYCCGCFRRAGEYYWRGGDGLLVGVLWMGGGILLMGWGWRGCVPSLDGWGGIFLVGDALDGWGNIIGGDALIGWLGEYTIGGLK
jgi:hypothetical protein